MQGNLPQMRIWGPYRERKWIDVDPGKYSQGCFEVSKFMIRLLRHDDTVREDDGAVRFDDLAEGCFEVSKFMIRLLRHDDTVREDDGAAGWTLPHYAKSRRPVRQHREIQPRAGGARELLLLFSGMHDSIAFL